MEELRQQLDSWFGANRNGDRPEAVIRDFRDPKVCKNFLLGLCPHTLFTNTRDDLGACHLVHDERLKKAYEDVARSYDFGYERGLERTLESILNEAERKIAKSRDRVSEEDPTVSAFINTLSLENAPELLDLNNLMDDKLIEMERAQDRGDYEVAGKLSEEIEELKKNKYEIQAKLLLGTATEEDRKPSAVTNKQKLRVCDVCGAYLSLNDSEDRIADHFGGKSHLGYLTIRQKLNHLKEWRKTQRASAAGGSVAPASAVPAERERERERGDDRERFGRDDRRRSHSRERHDYRRDDRRDDYRRDDYHRRDDRYDSRRDYRGGGGDRRDDRRDYREYRDDRDKPRDRDGYRDHRRY